MKEVKQRKYRTQGNYWKYNQDEAIVNGESFDLESEPSLTIPDMALSVKEILERFSRGGQVQQLQPQYLEGELTDEQISRSIDLNSYDKMERLELLGRTRKYVDQVRQELQSRKQQATEEVKQEQPVIEDED